MSEEAAMEVVNEFMRSLDRGDVDGLLACCHPDIIVCNERTPTFTGIAKMRAKYAPRIEAAKTQSKFEPEHTAIFDDFLITVGKFSVHATPRDGSEARTAEGRLTLGLKNTPDRGWLILLDVDNN